MNPTPVPLPRLVPDQPLPPYTFVPGRSPHPTSDPRGHSFGKPPEPADPPDPERWRECRPYLYAIDLFNHGYYWEAHEAWEALWHACARSGRTADFLKALIKLAAAGVKVREGKPAGVRNHARRAADLLERLADANGKHIRYMGLDLNQLIHFARTLAERVPSVPETNGPAVVFDFVLFPA
jgi:hypothetical protein